MDSQTSNTAHDRLALFESSVSINDRCKMRRH